MFDGSVSKLKTPHQKKTASLAKDTRSPSGYSKAARKSVPRKKARLNRAHRHALHQSLHVDGAPVPAVDVDGLDEAAGGLRRKQLEKRPAVPLGERIADREAARAGRTGRRAARAKATKPS